MDDQQITSALVPLREYIERIIADLERSVDQRFAGSQRANETALVAAKEAISVALTAAERSATAALEANKVLAAKAAEFADQKLETHNAIKPWMQSQIENMSGKVELIENGLGTRIDHVEKRISRFENREEGISATTRIIIGAIGLLLTLVTLYFALKKF